MEIRDGRLYRASHGTFESYCRERWGWGRHYVNRHIQAAEVVGLLVPMGTIVPPVSERVARELAPLSDSPETVREVWSETVERHGLEPTAREVRGVAARRLRHAS